MAFKSGFICIVGKPNVGKSTLINVLVKSKISFVSDKPNFTMNKIIGIYNEENLQLIFIDTPGFNNQKFLLTKRMNDIAFQSIQDVDIVLFLVTDVLKEDVKEILTNIKKYQKPIFLVINKIDNLKNNMEIDKIILSYLKYFEFDAIIPISALNAKNLNFLRNNILSFLKEGSKYYPSSTVTTQPKESLIAELVREKIFFYCQQEIPYYVGTMVERIEKLSKKKIEIWVLILVEKMSQKKILIGAQGSKLKQISTKARIDMQNILNQEIYLNLWVKIEKKWRNNLYLLKQLGYV